MSDVAARRIAPVVRVGSDRGAVRDHDDLRRVDVEPRHQELSPGLGHDHDRAGGLGNRLENRALVCRRGPQDGVGDHDRRCFDRGEDVDDRIAVPARVEAVLVLDDHDIGPLQRSQRLGGGRRAAVREGCHHPSVLSAARIADPDDLDVVVATASEPFAQGGGERRDAAGRRGERRDDRVGAALAQGR